MNEYRCLFYLGVLNNCLYAVGGINWTGVLGSVEVYHCDQDVWQRDTDLPYLVHEHAGKIFFLLILSRRTGQIW